MTWPLLQHESLYQVLVRTDWNMTYTASQLDISIRTVRNWIDKLEAAGYEIPANVKSRRGVCVIPQKSKYGF